MLPCIADGSTNNKWFILRLPSVIFGSLSTLCRVMRMNKFVVLWGIKTVWLQKSGCVVSEHWEYHCHYWGKKHDLLHFHSEWNTQRPLSGWHLPSSEDADPPVCDDKALSSTRQQFRKRWGIKTCFWRECRLGQGRADKIGGLRTN